MASDELAREKMHNASTIAGMAFTNAFLGINHSLAHKLGGEFHIPHGRANAILLPHVIRYNATKPKKFIAFPKYDHFIADERYAEIARILGFPARQQRRSRKLVQQLLMQKSNIPWVLRKLTTTWLDKGIRIRVILADRAFEDQCTTANPKLPLVTELAEIYRQAYKGV